MQLHCQISEFNKDSEKRHFVSYSVCGKNMGGNGFRAHTRTRSGKFHAVWFVTNPLSSVFAQSPSRIRLEINASQPLETFHSIFRAFIRINFTILVEKTCFESAANVLESCTAHLKWCSRNFRSDAFYVVAVHCASRSNRRQRDSPPI